MDSSKLSKELGYTNYFSPQETVEITSGYTSDLLSDVIANAPAESVLITIQSHKNSIAVASLAGISAVLICNGRKIPDDMRKAAEENDIAIFTTDDNQFMASAKVAGLLGLPLLNQE